MDGNVKTDVIFVLTINVYYIIFNVRWYLQWSPLYYNCDERQNERTILNEKGRYAESLYIFPFFLPPIGQIQNYPFSYWSHTKCALFPLVGLKITSCDITCMLCWRRSTKSTTLTEPFVCTTSCLICVAADRRWRLNTAAAVSLNNPSKATAAQQRHNTHHISHSSK